MNVQATAGEAAARGMSGRASTFLLALPTLVLLVFLFAIPTLQFLFRAVQANDGSPTFAHIQRLMANPAYIRVMWQSIEISVWVTIITILVSYPVAYVLARADKSARSYWAIFVLLPFWSSFLVRTFALLVVMGRNGPLNAAIQTLGLSDGPLPLLYSRGAVLFGITNVMTPFAVLTMVGVMERVEPRLLSAAQSLGAHPLQTFFRVFLPLSMPGVTAAALLVFVTSLGFFITPALLGSQRETMMAQPIIQQVIDLSNWSFAAVLCLVLVAITALIFLLFNRLVGMSSLLGEPSSRGSQRVGTGRFLQTVLDRIGDVLSAVVRRLHLPARWNGVGRFAMLVTVAVLAVLNVPVLFLIPVSVAKAGLVAWPPSGFSLQWYEQFFSSSIWMDATLRSFGVALLTAFGCFLIGVPAALAYTRMSGKSAAAMFTLIVSPMVLPKIIIAVGLFYLYARIGMVGTTLGLVLGHMIVAIPFFFISTLAVLRTYDWRLDLAAASLGASPWRTVRHVTIPLIATGLLSASLFAFIISIDELNIALFTSGGLASTLPKMMWENATIGFTPLLAAVSTLLLVFLTVLVVAGIRINAARR